MAHVVPIADITKRRLRHLAKRAYARSVARFLAWCEEKGVELRQITPGLAGEYVGQLAVSPPTKNQALAALRHFFDGLVTRHAVALNPFASVRGIKHSAAEGTTQAVS
jgi:site-specific recombinase XerD